MRGSERQGTQNDMRRSEFTDTLTTINEFAENVEEPLPMSCVKRHGLWSGANNFDEIPSGTHDIKQRFHMVYS